MIAVNYPSLKERVSAKGKKGMKNLVLVGALALAGCAGTEVNGFKVIDREDGTWRVYNITPRMITPQFERDARAAVEQHTGCQVTAMAGNPGNWVAEVACPSS